MWQPQRNFSTFIFIKVKELSLELLIFKYGSRVPMPMTARIPYSKAKTEGGLSPKGQMGEAYDLERLMLSDRDQRARNAGHWETETPGSQPQG